MGRHKKEEVSGVEMKIEEKKIVNLGKLGTANRATRISYLGKKSVNGRELNDVHLEDGTTYLLSDEDLAKQMIEKPEAPVEDVSIPQP